MKLKNKMLTVGAVAVTGAALAVIPLTTSHAAEACAAPWTATQVYNGGNVASQNGHNYRAKWWNQNESPATHSTEWAVWADQGVCGGVTPPTTPPTTTPGEPTTPPPVGKMAAAPYLYPGWGNPPRDIAAVMRDTGIRSFTLAFVLANGCNPVWDNGSAIAQGTHADYIRAIKAAGGTVVPSFGGWQGNKLGPNCATKELLAGAYQKVIDAFGLTAIDIDIENTDEFENPVVADRIVEALGIIKRDNPRVTTIVTFGTTQTGPTPTGNRLIEQAKARNANIDIFTQMPFDFADGNRGTDMYAATLGATEGLKNKLKATFGWTDQQAYARIGISGMNGLSDRDEITTLDQWTRITAYAKSKGLARLAFWGVNRDRGCAGQPLSSECSSIAQADWAFTKVSATF